MSAFARSQTGLPWPPYVPPASGPASARVPRRARVTKPPSPKKEPASAPKRHRFRPAAAAIRQNRPFPEQSGFSIAKAAFQRVVREIGAEIKPGLRFQPDALEALQEAAEAHLAELFKEARLEANHARRVTIKPRDLALARRVRGKK